MINAGPASPPTATRPRGRTTREAGPPQAARQSTPSPETFRVKMRDGVILATDVYVAEGEGPFPTLLERTPYGRRRCDQSEQSTGATAPPQRAEVVARYLEEGFAVIVQDCRGCGESGGRFEKYIQEPEDSADTIAWAKAQPWCGPLRTTGFSYGAMWQLCALSQDNHQVDAAFIDCGGFYDAFASALREGGALDLKQATWAMAQDAREAEAVRPDADTVLSWLKRGPFVPGNAPFADDSPYLQALMAFWQNAKRSPFWHRPAFCAADTIAASLGTPTLFVTSWHDTSLVNVVSAFNARAHLGERAQRLIIGPWSHGDRHLTYAGEADFGEDALPEVGLGATVQDLRLGFLTRPHATGGPPVRYFVMGGGTGKRHDDGRIDHGGGWQSAIAWPPAHTSHTLQLSPAGLSDGAPTDRFACAFVSDPERPVPTLGGAINSGEPVMAGGMFDQTALFRVVGGKSVREDVLSFLTAPLTEDVVIAGPVSAELWLSADVTDADVTIKLIDVYADDGPALNLCEGILRLRFRDGFDREVHLPRGEPVKAVVEAFPTANRFAKGHRIRLDIAGSNFPHFDINPQTGGPLGLPGERRKGTITIHGGPDTPSTLTLPVVEGAA